MKKAVLVIIALIGFGFAASAQSAIGLRGAFGSRSGIEVSYQTPAWGERLEVDLGWNSYSDCNSIYVGGIYQWVWNIVSNLNWYAGAGASLGAHFGDNAGFGLGILGQIGLEWTFNPVPIKLSVDLRPQVDVFGSSHFGFAGALGIRYVF